MLKFIKSPNFLLIIISIFFAIIPFFWLKPGEMDLGGDSNRLYFYDPSTYITNVALSIVSPDGMGGVDPQFYFLPYLILIMGLKSFLGSSTLVISLFNTFKLLGGFLAIYYIVLEILTILHKNKNGNQKNINIFSSILAGLFYILSPISSGNWDKALTSHNQIFLNPFIFLLLLKFFTTNNSKYVWLTLLITLLFAPNFGFTSAPAFFAFYPLSLLFLILFLIIIKANKVSWKKIFAIPFFFFGLHTFHLAPQIFNLFDPGSFSNTRVFNNESITHEGIRYFNALLPLSKVSWAILLPSTTNFFQLIYSIVPLIIIIDFIFIKKKQKMFILTGIFFLITLYFFSANITNLGIELYQHLFYLPGFSMFRNFIGQWNMVYIFFYALLFGQAFSIVISKMVKSRRFYVSTILLCLFIFSSWPFLISPLNKPYSESKVKSTISLDPDYKKTLEFIKNIPDEGKILVLPFSDSFYQVVAGKDGGAYVGSSTISYLAGKKSFVGYQIMTATFSERLFAMSREKDYEGIKKLLSYLGIKYIFYNSDIKIYDSNFPAFPYSYARQSLPNTQKEYMEFVSKIAERKIFEKGPYQLFEVNESNYLPLFYVAKNVEFYSSLNKENIYDPSLFIQNTNKNIRTAYLDNNLCPQFTKTINCPKTMKDLKIPEISFSKINKTRYVIHVRHAKDPYFLIFSNAYHPQWRIFLTTKENQQGYPKESYFNGEIQEGKHTENFLYKPLETIELKEIAKFTHGVANGYANFWKISPEDVRRKEDYELIIEMSEQNVFYYSSIVSLIIFIIFLGWGIMLFLPVSIVDIIKKTYVSKTTKK